MCEMCADADVRLRRVEERLSCGLRTDYYGQLTDDTDRRSRPDPNYGGTQHAVLLGSLGRSTCHPILPKQMQGFDFLIPIDVDMNDESYIWGRIGANVILVMALKTWE